jgi:hypothetical protein
MYVVALTELATPLEAEAAALAADLGTTLYEERQTLLGGLPAIVRMSAERAPAAELLQKLRARGHGAVAFDSAAVVASDAMVSMRRFAFEPGAVTSLDMDGRVIERLPCDDILALLRATHRTRTETATETTQKKFSMGRAVLSGGLVMRKNVKSEERSVSEQHEGLLYLFRASGQTPWVLYERGTNYAGLGAELAASSLQNFLGVIARLRALAPGAAYDERLLKPRRLAPQALARSQTTQSSASGVDLMAHVIALSVARARA